MDIYDNSGSTKIPCSASYKIAFEDISIVYTYIRNNACSSFKNFFRWGSEYELGRGKETLREMGRYHLVRDYKVAESADYRIFVYRDPVERMVSLYKNKFIQGSGAEGMHRDYYALTGERAEDASFLDFITKYVSNVGREEKLNPHVLPQSWHLMPICYNAAIHIKKLGEEMKFLVGENASKEIFSSPYNSTSIKKNVFFGGGEGIKAYRYKEYLKTDGVYPSLESLVTEKIRRKIVEVYSDDYEMIGGVKSNG